jgi:hypothetical protein
MLLNEITGTLTQDPTKVGVRLYTDTVQKPSYFGPIANLAHFSKRLPKTHDAVGSWIHAGASGQQLSFLKSSKPNGTMGGFEGNPGLWVFTDKTGIRFFVFSDEHRKNAFKGTSIELELPKHFWLGDTQAEGMPTEPNEISDGIIDVAIEGALHRLFNKLRGSA